MKNKLISFEGIDGCGKTTQINLISNILKEKKIQHSIIREPGGADVSEKIRDILLDEDNDISSITETLLFLSARSQMVQEFVIPQLKNDNIVLCDRYIDSTVAYQGYGRGLNVELIDNINLFAIDEIVPQLTILFDIDPLIAFDRLNRKSLDRIELMGIEFLTKVREGYLKILDLNPDRFKKINCNDLDIMSINKKVVSLIELHLNKEI